MLSSLKYANVLRFKKIVKKNQDMSTNRKKKKDRT